MSGGGWTVLDDAGVVVLRCAPLEGVGPWRHGVSTRRGRSDETFDLRRRIDGGGVVADDRRRRLLRVLGLDGARLVEVAQVHGAAVLDAATARESSEGDALCLGGEVAGVAVGVRVADCVPVVIVDSHGRAAAAVHAGWRGVAAGVVGAATERLARAGAPAASLHAAVGPSIGPCCYRVGRDCARRVLGAVPDTDPGGAVVLNAPGGPRLDLGEAVRRQLVGAGLRPDRIHAAPWCTRCEPGLLFSHRGEGARAGRMLAVVGRPADPSRP